jgi:hypothetical protein
MMVAWSSKHLRLADGEIHVRTARDINCDSTKNDLIGSLAAPRGYAAASADQKGSPRPRGRDRMTAGGSARSQRRSNRPSGSGATASAAGLTSAGRVGVPTIALFRL